MKRHKGVDSKCRYEGWTWMDFTNINDPAGVKALLERLRESQAWQQAINSGSPAVSSPNVSNSVAPRFLTPGVEDGVAVEVHESNSGGSSSISEPSSSVASLLSQLQPSSIKPPQVPHTTPLDNVPPYQHISYPRGPELPSHTSPVSSHTAASEDLRWLTFQQALPRLARLSEDQGLVTAVKNLKKEQADLERSLWEERRAIQRAHEKKVDVARKKAHMAGATLTQYDADTMSRAFRSELEKFDAERVLPAWDGLVAKQQAALESLGVPNMFPTTATADREKQQRVMQVLANVVSD